MPDNIISSEKLTKYFSVTKAALAKAEVAVNPTRASEGKEILDMVNHYVSDAGFFRDKDDFVNAFAALNYAHGWLDTGARLGIFDVDDSDLFVVKN